LASHDIPIGATQVSLAALNERSREIFRQIVESYFATGEPVGSRNLSRLLPITLSPASVRNVMSDLEQLGLIYAPHTSAGRLPTELGLRFFVDALMQVGDLTEQDRRSIEAQVAGTGTAKSIEAVLTEASQMLSGLTRSAGRRCAVASTCCARSMPRSSKSGSWLMRAPAKFSRCAMQLIRRPATRPTIRATATTSRRGRRLGLRALSLRPTSNRCWMSRCSRGQRAGLPARQRPGCARRS